MRERETERRIKRLNERKIVSKRVEAKHEIDKRKTKRKKKFPAGIKDSKRMIIKQIEKEREREIRRERERE